MNADKNGLGFREDLFMTGVTVGSAREVLVESTIKADRGYNIPLGYLRACITAMVVAHHAMLAYHPYAPPPPASLGAQPQWWRAFPVVDTQRWTGFSLLVGFNDVFFMSLMFLLSGLFVWNSLERKGTGIFLRDRMVRLGLPFLGAVAIVAPIAYYPTYLQSGAHTDFAGFRRVWLSLSEWPSGPAWFVWVLLAFGCVAALLSLGMPKWGERLGQLLSGASRRPARFFWLLVAISAATYLPLALGFDPMRWTAWGPFVFQTSRILHYFAYFLIGAGLGAWGIGRDLLALDGKLARRWWVWALGAIGAFLAVMVVTVIALTTQNTSTGMGVIGGVGFAVSCATSSFAFLAIFLRFAKTRNAVWDSLRDNAYGIYLVHYAFVSWVQYALLGVGAPAVVKGTIAFLGALALSWGTTAMFRKIPGVARVI
jgi:hypothetical protein